MSITPKFLEQVADPDQKNEPVDVIFQALVVGVNSRVFRGRHFSFYELHQDDSLINLINKKGLTKADIAQALNQLVQMQIVERADDGWQIRDHPANKVSHFVAHRRALTTLAMKTLIYRTRPADSEALKLVEIALARMKECLDKHLPARLFILWHGRFLQRIAGLSASEHYTEALKSLGEKILCGRIVYPQHLEGLLNECVEACSLLAEGNYYEARQLLDRQLQQQERDARRIAGWLERARGEYSEAKSRCVDLCWPMIDRLLKERYSDRSLIPPIYDLEALNLILNDELTNYVGSMKACINASIFVDLCIRILCIRQGDPGELYNLLDLHCTEIEQNIFRHMRLGHSFKEIADIFAQHVEDQNKNWATYSLEKSSSHLLPLKEAGVKSAAYRGRKRITEVLRVFADLYKYTRDLNIGQYRNSGNPLVDFFGWHPK